MLKQSMKKVNTKPYRKYLEELAEIQRETKTKEFVYGIRAWRCKLPVIKCAGNACQTVTLVTVRREFHGRHGAGYCIAKGRKKKRQKTTHDTLLSPPTSLNDYQD